MATISRVRISLQLKISASYIAIILIVVLLMNTYPLLVSQDLVFRSKRTNLLSSASALNAAVAGLEELTEENVSQALAAVESEGISRAIVTDPYGKVLYDTREAGNAAGHYVFYNELVEALRGNSAMYSVYKEGAFHSAAAQPVLHRNQIIGGVYVYEFDTRQASLLETLRNNLLSISIGVAVLVLAMSTVFSHQLTQRLDSLQAAIRGVREGAYNQRAILTGHDEFTQIAGEFNDLVDRLQKTESARRQFVSDASHELKTPLAAIRLLTDSILQNETMEGDTLREFVSDIGQEAERLSRITEDLLRLTRLDSGVAEIPSRIEAGPVLERVVRMLRPVAEEKGVDLLTNCSNAPAVIATEGELYQILYNLAENAIKYNRRGGYVLVRIEREEEVTVITVEDNGIGIPDEDQARVFERFYRVDKARSRHRQPPGRGHPGRERPRGGGPVYCQSPLFGARGGGGMRRWGAALLAALLALTACAAPEEPAEEPMGLLLYYLAPEEAARGGDRIRGVYEPLDLPEDAGTAETARAVVERLLLGSSDGTLDSPLPGGTELLGLEIRDRRACVDLSSTAGQLSGVELAMADYCVTLSLTGLEGIGSVSVTVQGRSIGQQPKQVFYERDVLLSDMDDVLQTVEVTLYFLNGEGALTGERRTLSLYEGQTLAESLVAALLEGPENRELRRAAPDGFAVNYVRVDSGTCYVSLPAASLALLPEDEGAQRAILWSLAESLYSIESVEELRLLADGEELSFFGSIPVESVAARPKG